MTCKICNSHAINHDKHGRDGSDPDLCDVCYWRKRAAVFRPISPSFAMFRVGDLVSKPKGYSFDGNVRSVFQTLAGEVRIVAELTTSNGLGMLHIFSPSQLEPRKDQP